MSERCARGVRPLEASFEEESEMGNAGAVIGSCFNSRSTVVFACRSGSQLPTPFFSGATRPATVASWNASYVTDHVRPEIWATRLRK